MVSPTSLRRVLIVEDNDALRAAMVKMVRQLCVEVVEAATARAAIELLSEHPPDLVIADVCLPDGSAIAVFQAARDLVPEPLKIGISGQASAEQAFELSQVGVRAYLAKPFFLKDLSATIQRLRSEPPPLEPVVRATVGHVSLREVTAQVRTVMIDEALARSHGSRSGAARLLDVSRQAVQQIARQMRNDPAPRESYATSPDPAPGPSRATASE